MGIPGDGGGCASGRLPSRTPPLAMSAVSTSTALCWPVVCQPPDPALGQDSPNTTTSAQGQDDCPGGTQPPLSSAGGATWALLPFLVPVPYLAAPVATSLRMLLGAIGSTSRSPFQAL